MKRLFAKQIFRPGIRITSTQLLVACTLGVILTFLNQLSVQKEPRQEYQQMVSAVETVHKATREVQAYRNELGIPFDPGIDPRNSGFIGIEFSPITTTLGNIQAKLTSTNPDFAALLVYWLHQLKLNSEQRAIIHASGSFPALSIAAIIACETIGIEPIICSSAGASSFGANIPQLTYWDIENYLWQKGIIKHRTQYATPGGDHDNGSSLWEGGMQIVQDAATRNNNHLIISSSLEDAIIRKWNFFQKFRPFAVFINIGGNQTALGNNTCSLNIPTGLIQSSLPCTDSNAGLIQLFCQEKIPIIHLLNIRNIAVQNGLALSPHFFLQPGQAPLYYSIQRPLWLPILSFLIILGSLIYYQLTRNRNS
jgi:poly-gamma-glutamate system protein